MIKIVAAALAPIVVYAFAAFILMESNPANWSEGARFVVAATTISAWLMTVLYITEQK